MRDPVGEVPSPWARTACSRYRSRWHVSPRSQAEVTVRPFPWLHHVTLIFPRIFEHAFFSMPCFFLNDGPCKASGKPVTLCEQQLVFQFILFEAIRVFQPCACTCCCSTKASASSVLLTASLVLCSVFLFFSQLCIHLITCTITDSC